MQTCPDCSRHVWDGEGRCPFCSAALRYAQGTPVVISALVSLALFACNGGSGDETTGETTGSSSSGTDSLSSTNGMTTTATSAPTSSETMATADTSTSDTPTSDPTTSTSTSTSTSDPSTSSSGDTSTSETGTTADTATTAATTGGACMVPGEEVCDGVCVDTQMNNMNCGMCGKVCDAAMSEFCIQGECMVVFPPYGGPMPGPAWV